MLIYLETYIITTYTSFFPGDMFTTLGEIPFEWQMEANTSQKPLRIVSFSQSKYETPEGIRYLESLKKRGIYFYFIFFSIFL